MPNKRGSPSILLRLLGASLLILPLFLGATAWVLDRAFADYQDGAQRESMRLQQLLLAKAIDWDGAAWTVDGLDEPRLALPNSGLYAFVISPGAQILWRSPSAQQMGPGPAGPARIARALQALDIDSLAIGQHHFAGCFLDSPYFCQASRIAWGSDGPEGIFLIMESQARVLAARDTYREYLLWLLLGATVLLLLAQWFIFRWGLAPMRAIADRIGSLERGEADRLDGSYPEELVPLTDNINILLASEKSRRERVRNTMDRLTHVLKTPLMLLRNSTDTDAEFRGLVQDQVTRMLGIVEGELAKARLDGRPANILGKPVLVAPVLRRITDAYARLPRPGGNAAQLDDVNIDTTAISAEAVFRGDERDLQDLFGSVLENSLKYCRQQVVVGARMRDGDAGPSLEITIGDDGDGIEPGMEQEILQRGARADSANTGQGLGLSIVIEIISAYGGSLEIERSELGGALFIILLPADPA